MTRMAADVSSEGDTISSARTSLRFAPVTSVVVDASCFSLPYDYSLCDALADEGCRVFLARSEFLAGEWTRRANRFEAWNHFYSLQSSQEAPRNFRSGVENHQSG